MRPGKKWEAAIRNKILAMTQAALLALTCAAPAPAAEADLDPQAARGYDRYLQLTEARMKPELAQGGAFLYVDSLPGPQRNELHARLDHGEVVTERLQTSDPSGMSRTPGALIHHWVGTILIPGATLEEVLAVLHDYNHHSELYNPEVVKSKILEHAGDDFKIYYRLRRKKIITVVLDTDYDVHYHPVTSGRTYSESHATRIAQVDHAGEPDEHQLPPGKDGGYLWRLDSYWRYVETGRGVYVQCEAVSLTRDIPTGLNWLIGPFVESIPRESLAFTLESTRAAVLHEGLKTKE